MTAGTRFATRFTNCMGTEFRYGKIVFPVADTYLFQSLAECGDYSYGETLVYDRLLDAGDHVLDVGGNIGAMALFFSQSVGPGGRVRSFEPSPFTFGLLEHNIALNGCGNVQCNRAIVSEESGSGIYLDPDMARIARMNLGGVSVGTDTAKIPGAMVETPKIRIDDLGLERCDLIKIDVEGHEARVVSGALETIDRHAPFLSIETGNEKDDLSWLDPVLAAGYRVFCISFRIVSWPNLKRRDISGFSRDVTVNAICIPPGREQMSLLDGFPRREVRSTAQLVALCRSYGKK